MNHKKTELPTVINFPISPRHVYHLAGQIASIYLNNSLKGLPPVYFQLALTAVGLRQSVSGVVSEMTTKQKLKLEGGRLLPDLPVSFEVATGQLTAIHRQQCLVAFEADMINLLAGPLAEAKFIAHRDDESFTSNVITLEALRFYGGILVLDILRDYLNCLFPNQAHEQQKKLADVFSTAFRFIDDSRNWFAIFTLANAIIDGRKIIYTCEELINWLELACSINNQSITHRQYRSQLNSMV